MVGAMVVWLVGLALVAGLAARVFRGYPPSPRDLAALDAREYAFVAAAAEAMFPRGGALEPSGADAHVARYADGFVASQTPRLRLLMRLLFFLCEHATLLLPAPGRGGFRRFTRLSPAAQARYLDGWRLSSSSARRLVFTSLRAILAMGYLADPGVLRRLDLAPKRIETPITAADLLWPRVGEPSADIPYGPDDLTPPSDGVPLAHDAPLHPDYVEDAGRRDAS
jgi:hypothetical protein